MTELTSIRSTNCFQNYEIKTSPLSLALIALGIILVVSSLIAHYRGMGNGCVITLASTGGLLSVAGLLALFFHEKSTDKKKKNEALIAKINGMIEKKMRRNKEPLFDYTFKILKEECCEWDDRMEIAKTVEDAYRKRGIPLNFEWGDDRTDTIKFSVYQKLPSAFSSRPLSQKRM